ncbi:MAG: lamin tail domain-containing protein, partial [Candidatus Zixiibacteriota bacterium]
MASAAKAQPVVNEVLANEPGSVTGLEWIELYNDGQPVNLQDFSLRVGDNLIELPSEVNLSDGEYYIICRRLFATSTSPGFESIWGDSSGVWG